MYPTTDDKRSDIIECARAVLINEARTLIDAAPRLGEGFISAVNILLKTRGRIIVTGMGKPGYIAHKIAATLASTGTPAFWLHPAEGVHGDLGMVTSADSLLILSNSGETPEILALLPTLKRIGVPIIALCGNPASSLTKHSDAILDASVEEECCPLRLAPMNSTTLALALGDALAAVLMKIRDFKKEDFAFYHPGGSLGKRLLLTVGDVMKAGESRCAVRQTATILETLFTMTSSKTGAVSVTDDDQRLIGIVTDGDIRRYVMYNNLFLDNPVTEVMTTAPTWIYADELVEAAIRKMEQHSPAAITVLPVLDRQETVCGILNVADLMKHHLL